MVRTAWDNADDNADTVYTNAKGEFNSHELSTIAIDQQKVYFDDTDGENKGGAFKSDSIALEKMDKKQLKKGNGWFEGQFEYTAPVVKLSKEGKKPTDGYVADKEEDMLSNYMELDALMQVIFPLKEGEADN